MHDNYFHGFTEDAGTPVVIDVTLVVLVIRLTRADISSFFFDVSRFIHGHGCLMVCRHSHKPNCINLDFRLSPWN